MEVTRKDLETVCFGVADTSMAGSSEGLLHVRVEPGRLVACNGRILIVREVVDDGEPFEPFSVSVADIKGAIKANAALWKHNGDPVKIDTGSEFMANIGRKQVLKQDVTYPDWQTVLVKKNKPDHKKARFNPELMMRALQGMKDVDVVELRVWDEKTPARLDGITKDGRKIMALVMPTIPK